MLAICLFCSCHDSHEISCTFRPLFSSAGADVESCSKRQVAQHRGESSASLSCKVSADYSAACTFPSDMLRAVGQRSTDAAPFHMQRKILILILILLLILILILILIPIPILILFLAFCQDLRVQASGSKHTLASPSTCSSLVCRAIRTRARAYSCLQCRTRRSTVFTNMPKNMECQYSVVAKTPSCQVDQLSTHRWRH